MLYVVTMMCSFMSIFAIILINCNHLNRDVEILLQIATLVSLNFIKLQFIRQISRKGLKKLSKCMYKDN